MLLFRNVLPPQYMLPVLHQCLGLPARALQHLEPLSTPASDAFIPKKEVLTDCLFVSIDCDHRHIDGKPSRVPGLPRHRRGPGPREIGVSTLDTRVLNRLSASSVSASELQKSISSYSYHFVKKPRFSPPTTLFQRVVLDEVQNFQFPLDNFLQIGNPQASDELSEKRNTILVGNLLDGDLELLHESLVVAPSIPKLDTASIIRHIDAEKQQNPNRSFRLGPLLKLHSVSCLKLSSPALRSRSMLKLLLVLAVKNVEEGLLSEEQKSILLTLELLGRIEERFQDGNEEAERDQRSAQLKTGQEPSQGYGSDLR
jgi:hypothetical protein